MGDLDKLYAAIEGRTNYSMDECEDDSPNEKCRVVLFNSADEIAAVLRAAESVNRDCDELHMPLAEAVAALATKLNGDNAV